MAQAMAQVVQNGAPSYYGDQPAWMDRAECRGYTLTFFGESQKTVGKTADAAIMQQAQARCRRCPVVRECLTWAFASEHSTRWGVYGGTIPQQRLSVKHLADPVSALLGEEDECQTA